MISRMRFSRSKVSMIAILLAYTPVAFAENCLSYSKEADKLRCMEEFYRRSNDGIGANVSGDKKHATRKSQGLEGSRTIISPKGSDHVDAARREPREGSIGKGENIDAVLTNLAGQYHKEAAGKITSDEAKAAAEARRYEQSQSYYNACATEYCRTAIEPYQRKVDELRGTKGAAKDAAEAELRWQFRVRANPP